MTSFETEVYNREGENVIGARVIVSADNGQTIDEIQVTNKTQFDELKGKLDTLNEDYVQFEDNSPLAGKTLDNILNNSGSSSNINAKTLGGITSAGYSKTGHKHPKADITDLYNYDITASNYNMNLGSSANADKQSTISVKVTNMSNSPVSNHQIIMYKNGTLWKTGYTNANGLYSVSYSAETEGVVTFQVNNQKIQCNVKYDTGWVNLDLSRVSAIFAISSPMQIRRIGNIVHIRGAVKTKDNTTFIGGWDDYWNIGTFPDSRFNPSQDETFVTQSSKKQRCTVQVKKGGFIWVGRFTDSNSSGQYTMPKDLWIPVALTYFVD